MTTQTQNANLSFNLANTNLFYSGGSHKRDAMFIGAHTAALRTTAIVLF